MTGNTMPGTVVPTNGETSVCDLFALSDEQILEIEAEPQDIEIADVHLDDADRAVLGPPITGGDDQDLTLKVREPRTSIAGGSNAEATPAVTSHPSPTTSHDPSAPPQWLADRMSDPQAGAQARALWDSVQQSRAEAAGFREIFAKPEEARAAAQRARLLDDIDRAYFAGDATQRASLAASMMREDPAAFREMVFAGLRALEEGAVRHRARTPTSTPRHRIRSMARSRAMLLLLARTTRPATARLTALSLRCRRPKRRMLPPLRTRTHNASRAKPLAMRGILRETRPTRDRDNQTQRLPTTSPRTMPPSSAPPMTISNASLAEPSLGRSIARCRTVVAAATRPCARAWPRASARR
jgi:hypothetical protein